VRHHQKADDVHAELAAVLDVLLAMSASVECVAIRTDTRPRRAPLEILDGADAGQQQHRDLRAVTLLDAASIHSRSLCALNP
jgi:hypothetical protein